MVRLSPEVRRLIQRDLCRVVESLERLRKNPGQNYIVMDVDYLDPTVSMEDGAVPFGDECGELFYQIGNKVALEMALTEGEVPLYMAERRLPKYLLPLVQVSDFID